MSSLTLDGAGRWAEVPQLPPEVASPCEAFDDTVERCREMVDWVEKDLERGAIGGEPVEEAR